MENTFEQKKKKPGLKFNPGLALIGLRTTGPRAQQLIPASHHTTQNSNNIINYIHVCWHDPEVVMLPVTLKC